MEAKPVESKSILTLEQVKDILPKSQVHYFRFSMHHNYYVLVGEKSDIHYVYPSDEMYELLQKHHAIVMDHDLSTLVSLKIDSKQVHMSCHGSLAKERDDAQLLFAEAHGVKTWWLKDWAAYIKNLAIVPIFTPMTKFETFFDKARAR